MRLQTHRGNPLQNRDPIPQVMESRSSVLGSHFEHHGKTEKSNMKMGKNVDPLL